MLQFGRSLLRSLLASLLALCLALTLHACQTAEVSQPLTSTASSPAVTPAVPSPAAPVAASPLPPATQALVDRIGSLIDPPRGDVRLAVISDLNDAYGSTDYPPEVDQGITLLPFWRPDLVICGGDMVAGQDPSLPDDRFAQMWAAFDAHVAAPLRQAKLPFGFTVGNHDASSALAIRGSFLFQRERDATAAYWNQPAHDPGVEFVDRFEFPFYYTFKHQDVFFVVWDGSSSYIPPEKLAWVEKTLASPEAQSAKLRILVGHLPLYAVAVGRDEPAEVMENAEQLRAMLEKYKVHTYISGHDHAYYPAHRGKLQLLHAGLLGAGPRPLLDSDLAPRKTITIVDIRFDSPELTTYTTYDAQTWATIGNPELPRFLTGHNGMVLRRDVELSDLTADETSFCQARIGADLCRA